MLATIKTKLAQEVKLKKLDIAFASNEKEKEEYKDVQPEPTTAYAILIRQSSMTIGQFFVHHYLTMIPNFTIICNDKLLIMNE